MVEASADQVRASPGAPTVTMAQAVGSYCERPVPGQLGEHFQCVWAHRMPDTDPIAIVVVPDACVDLIWTEQGLRLAGPDRVYQPETPTPGATIIGFRFQPGVSASWLGVPLSELVNQRLALAELWGREAESIADEICGAGSLREQADLFASALLRRAPAATPAPDLAQVAFRLLAAGTERGEAMTPRLVSELGVSERTIRRHFDERFGYGPKAVDRILRFQRFLRLVRDGRVRSLAQLAVTVGYADQAYLTRECRRLSGFTPEQIVRMAWPNVDPETVWSARNRPAGMVNEGFR